jgi:hypothetical protein
MTMAGKSTTFQPDRAGLPTPQVQDNVHHVADRTHEFEAHKGENIARAGGKPKRSVVQVHGGMTSRQTALKGMQHANSEAPDANPASPLTKEPGRKVFKAAAPVIGQRSRTAPHSTGLGDAILNAAFDASAPDDRSAHGRKP